MNYISSFFKDKDIVDKNVILNEQFDKCKVLTSDDVSHIVLKLNFISQSSLSYNNTFYRDLEVFNTYDKNTTNATIFDKLNNTLTVGGKELFKKIIENPIHDINMLVKRKESIQKLNKIFDSDKETYFKVKSCLESLKTQESTLHWFLQMTNDDFESMKHMLYFPKILSFLQLNRSGTFITCKNVFKIFISPVIGILSPLTYFIIPYCVLRFKYKFKISFKFYIRQIFNTLISMYQLTTKVMSINTLWIAFSAMIYFQNIITSIDLSKLYNLLTDFIIDKIDSLADYVKNTKQISSIINNKQIISPFFNYEINTSNYSHLMNNSKYSYKYFNNFGNKLKIYKNLDKAIILNILEESYVCDAAFNIYNLKNIFAMSMTNYKFSKHPTIKIKNFYHPLNYTNRITNSAVINNKSNMIITGPNAAGKSTFIKSIALNILLSQTICLTFSEKLLITPFHYIASQINTYDINGQKSLFQAEMYNIKNIIDDIDNHSRKSEKSIVFLDELFNSTNIVEGVASSYAICDKLSKITTNLNIFATHFIYLCKLSRNKKYVNYKFEADIKNEEINFTYKIKKGISNQYIALEILRTNNFDKDIIDASIDIKNNIMSLKN